MRYLSEKQQTMFNNLLKTKLKILFYKLTHNDRIVECSIFKNMFLHRSRRPFDFFATTEKNVCSRKVLVSCRRSFVQGAIWSQCYWRRKSVWKFSQEDDDDEGQSCHGGRATDDGDKSLTKNWFAVLAAPDVMADSEIIPIEVVRGKIFLGIGVGVS